MRGEALRLTREQGSRPVPDKLHTYLLEIRGQVLPKSEAGKATFDRGLCTSPNSSPNTG